MGSSYLPPDVSIELQRVWKELDKTLGSLNVATGGGRLHDSLLTDDLFWSFYPWLVFGGSWFRIRVLSRKMGLWGAKTASFAHDNG